MTQNEALDLMKMGHNIFLTGAAGSGKTFLLNKYIKFLKDRQVSIGLTASTGIASTHISGRTIHSWSGIGIKDSIGKKELNNIVQNNKTANRLRNAKVLIIDEVSMLHAHQLDMVDKVLQFIKQSALPFGGLQVILCGDFFQLPPVKSKNAGAFITNCNAWQTSGLKFCYLDEQFRQDDEALMDILNNMRQGELTEDDVENLTSRLNAENINATTLTKLYTHNYDVDVINNRELNKINAPSKKYIMYSQGKAILKETLKRGCLAPEELVLKPGAQVMFVKNNFDKGYVNGTLGRVKDFEDGLPIVETNTGHTIKVTPEVWIIEEDGFIQAEVKQFPLRLAWAITVHKSQGMTLDGAEIDLSKCFEYGMGYVALSRVRRLDCLRLWGLNQIALQVHPEILELDISLQKKSSQDAKELKSIEKKEILEFQKHFLKSIIPPELYKDIEEVLKDDFAMPKKLKKKERIPKHKLRLLKTKEMLAEKASLIEIAKENGLKITTIINHIERLHKKGEKADIAYLLPPKKDFEKIKKAFEKYGTEYLSPVYESLKEKYDYETLRLVRIALL